MVGRATWEARSGNLEITGTILAFALGPRETKENLCRDGRSQDLPVADFQPAVRYLMHAISGEIFLKLLRAAAFIELLGYVNCFF